MPPLNTIFRVAHDQLKLRGGIVRCGACNEVFDGNAALIEPAVAKAPMAPLPSSSAHAMSAELAVFDAAMAALDTHAAETLPPDEAAAIYTLDVETAEQSDDVHPDHHADEAPSPDQSGQTTAVFDEAAIAAYDTPTTDDSLAPAALAPSAEEALDLDLDVDLDVDLDAQLDAQADAATARDTADTGADAEPATEAPLIDQPADDALSTAAIMDDAVPSLDHSDDVAPSPDHTDNADAADAGRYPGDDDDFGPAL